MNLIDYSAKELLEKFGAGNHKPGSGSAAAFQGLLSAQLIRTFISWSKIVTAYSCLSKKYKVKILSRKKGLLILQ